MKNYLIDKFNKENWTNADYSNFLFENNNIKDLKSTEFIIKSSKLLQNYKEDPFWLKSPKEAFEFLLNEIKKEKFSLDDISFVLPNDIIIAGFEEFILEYVNSRNYIEIREKRIKKKLSKEQEMDLILAETIRKMFETKKEKQVSKEEETMSK